MAYSKALAAWLPGLSADVDGNLAITKASLPEMAVAEAYGAAADFPNVLYAALQALYVQWLATAVADRPASWAVYKSESPGAVEGESSVSFNITFLTALAVDAKNVKAG